jgi:hypothetical protein
MRCDNFKTPYMVNNRMHKISITPLINLRDIKVVKMSENLYKESKPIYIADFEKRLPLFMKHVYIKN